MASVFKVYGITGDAKEWFAQHYFGTVQWEFDEAMSCYRCGDVYLTAYEDCASFEDTSEADFFGWTNETWIKLAAGKELIYGHYEEDTGNAEFIHIKDNVCIREFRSYDFESDVTNEGDDPVLNCWTDVAAFTDKNLF